MPTPKKTIVKIQISQFTGAGKTQMLVYNEDRSINYETDATESILTLMRGHPKLYFHAKKIPDPKKKGEFSIEIEGYAPIQNW